MEHAEKFSSMLRLNADALVFDPETYVRAADFGTDEDVRLFVGGDELDGIGEKVGDGLGEGGFVGDDGMRRIDSNVGGRWLHGRIGIDDFGDEFAYENWAKLQIRTGDAADGENVGHETFHPGGTMGDFGKVGPAVFGKEVAEVLFEGMVISGDSTDGCTQVMGNGVGEFFELTERFLERGGARGDFLFQFCGMLTEFLAGG